MFDLMTPAQAQASTESAIRALRGGDALAARRQLEQVQSAGRADSDALVGRAYACSHLRDMTAAVEAADPALALAPRDLRALMVKADLSAATGDDRAAAYYRPTTQAAHPPAQLPPALGQEVARAHERCEHYLRVFAEHLQQRLDPVAAETGGASERFKQSLDLLYGREQIYREEPRLYYFPKLPQIQFYPREGFPWPERLEAATAEIRAELLAVLEQGSQAFTPYVQGAASRPNLQQGGMLNNPAWSAFYLWEHGAEVAENATRCSRTMAALADLPLCRMPGRAPSILFSLLRPGGRIPPHNSFLNFRLICHLPSTADRAAPMRFSRRQRDARVGGGPGLSVRRHGRARGLEAQRPDPRGPSLRGLAAGSERGRAGDGQRDVRGH